jgi:DNA adenine methylase
MCQKNVEEVIGKVYEWRNTFPEGKELHRFLNDNIATFDDLEKAAAFFIYNRISFSGTSESGGYSQQAYHGRFTESSIHRLKQFGKVIAGARITNHDYHKLVEADGKDVFIFLDPPYYSATKSALYGKNGSLHKGFDHTRFAETMKECKHRWLITYDDSEYVREVFSFANIIAWDLTYGMRNVTETSNQKGKELFVSNYLTKLPKQLAYESQFTLFEPQAKYNAKLKRKTESV